MSRILPIRASMLHKRDIVLAGQRIKAASIFPFFNEHGVIDHLLIVDPVTPQLLVCQPSDVRRLPWLRAVEIGGATPLSRCDCMDELSELMHFDPWWVLAEQPFAMFEEVPVLKRTNCVDDFVEETTGLYFGGFLQEVRRVYTQKDGDYKLRAWSASLLRRQPASIVTVPDSVSEVGGWKLDPFWMSERD